MIYWDLANVKILNHSYFTINDLVRVVTLHATIMASGSLTYLMGCGVASKHKY
jgi:hypothetical protein